MSREQILFTHLFGSSPSVKILEFLIIQRGLWHSTNDIADGAKVRKQNAYDILSQLAKYGIVVQRWRGDSQIHHINQENSIAELLIALYKEVQRQSR